MEKKFMSEGEIVKHLPCDFSLWTLREKAMYVEHLRLLARSVEHHLDGCQIQRKNEIALNE